MGVVVNYVIANIACIVFLCIVMFTMRRSDDKQASTIALLYITRLLVLYFASDCVWILFECGIYHCNMITMYFLTSFPYICLLITAWLWHVYCEIIQGNDRMRSRQGMIISAIPLLIAIIIMIYGIFTNALFTIDATGYLEYGMLYAVLLCIPFGYMMYSSIKAFYRSFTSNRYYDHGLYIAMGLFPITPMVCGVLQAFYLTTPIMCYGATAAVLLQYITAIENRISIDALTQVNNRQEMQRYLSRKMKNRVQGMDLYLLILDVDKFKSINDTYGHVEGDKALVTVSDALKMSCSDTKSKTFLSRYGGDEFIAIMEAENEQQVQETVDTIRSNIEKLNEESGVAFKLEASIGYARFDYDNPVTIPQLIAKADEKLYEMKKTCR